MSSQRFSFSEDSIKDITDFYRQYLEDVNDNIIKLIDIFREFKEDTKYEVIGVEGNMVIEFYNEEIVKNIVKVCEEWASSPESLKAMAKNIKAGDEAEENAGKITDSLISSIEEIMVAQELIDLKDTSSVEISTDVYYELEERIIKEVESLEDIMQGAKTAYEQMVEDNTAAGALGALMGSVEGSILTPFNTLGRKIIGELKEAFIEKVNESKVISEEGAAATRQSAEKTMNTAEEELLSDMLKLLGDN